MLRKLDALNKQWTKIISQNYERAIVLEDDVRFSAEFIQLLHETMEDIDAASFEWDLIYLGRKRMADNDELFVRGISQGRKTQKRNLFALQTSVTSATSPTAIGQSVICSRILVHTSSSARALCRR